MKLELKHLAPYLPYGLKCIVPFKGGFYSQPKELTTNNISFAGDNGWKPKLRPMSDLMSDDFFLLRDAINELLEPNGLAINEVYCFLLYNTLENVSISYKEIYELMSLIYQNHFDVFGLIPAGLAVDINTI